jgi:hypothetical protein
MGEWRYCSTILYLDTRWRWAVSFTPRPLFQRHRVYRRLGGPQSRPGRFVIEKIFLPLLGSNPGNSARSPSQYRLLNYRNVNVCETFCLLKTTVSTEEICQFKHYLHAHNIRVMRPMWYASRFAPLKVIQNTRILKGRERIIYFL